jgi:2-oxoglutarate ferredoxin oxidoreductase subunit alpha
MGKALVVVSSDEHREDGHISETISDRIRMVDKRQAKWPVMLSEMHPPEATMRIATSCSWAGVD